MYKFKSNMDLKVKDYLDVKLVGENVIFIKEGKEVGRATAIDAKIFKKRKLKAKVTKKNKDNEYNVDVARFVFLHQHTGYSLLDGAAKIKDLVKALRIAGAITDHGTMSGFFHFYKEMLKQGKQPIVGFEAYVETITGEKKSNHLVLLAKNQIGYKNLIKLTSLAYENFYKKPHVSFEMLEKYSDGLIVLSGCLGGEIPRAINKGNYELAKEIAEKYLDLFGDDYYIEIQNHHIGEEEDRVNEGLIKLAREMNIKLVATTDNHYVNKEDKDIHEILLALQTGRTLSDEKRMRFQGDGYHVETDDEIDERFKHIPEALDNTLEIAEKCSGFELELGEIYLPKFDVPEGHTEASYFEYLTHKGFEDRFKGREEFDNPVYKKRLQHEINTIEQMGYSAYFLIVWDFIDYAKRNGIMVGPGRGSAAGSLVSFCLHITDIDPIPYGLLFERFLNPERVSMPDIDVDFCFERREEVIQYVQEKYGEEAVSGIVTFGTFAARGTVRDVARVLDCPYSTGDKIAKSIPDKVGMTIADALIENPELKAMYDNEQIVKKVIDTAMKLEGLPRHSSKHACGVIISDGPVDQYLPEFMAGKKDEKSRTSQVTMSEVEELGLLKMDFLGLKTMSIIGRAIESINKNTGGNLKYLEIPFNDPYVYNEISKGKSYAVFQLESPGMRSFMTDLYSDVENKIKTIESKHKVKGFNNPEGKGDKEAFMSEMKVFGQELFERLIAGVSLYRPGPMDYLPNYLKGMKNPDEIVYLTPMLEDILEPTYGTIVYQEQVMTIVQNLAGYSLGRADLVRRAMGKKELDVMRKEKEYFIDGKLNDDGSIDVPGCVRNGIPRQVAAEIWEQMSDFSKYAFNKSHAAVYALLGAVTGWLKYYHPVDFMAETMNIFVSISVKLNTYLGVANDMGIKILPPDVNSSSERFARDGDNIRFGLRGIRNMGKTSELIIEERNERGTFVDYQEFAVRMAKFQKLNKRVLDGAVYAGALDGFYGTRRAKLEVLDLILKEASTEKAAHDKGQVSIFDIMPEEAHLKAVITPDTEEFEKRYKLEKEKEFAGFYVTEHPLDDYTKYFRDEDITEIGYLMDDESEEDLDDEYAIKESYDGMKVKIAGIINDKKVFYTKKDNKPLYVFQIEGKTGAIKAVMFADNIERIGEKVEDGNVVIIDGVLKEDDFGLQIIANNIVDINDLKKKEKKVKALTVYVRNREQLNEFDREVLSVKSFAGDVPVFIKTNAATTRIKNNLNLDIALISKLDNMFSENYEIHYE